MLTNMPRLHAMMEQEGFDAVVATAPENVTYSSGFWAMTHWIRRGPQAYVLHPAPGRGAPVIIASSGVLDLVADQEPWVDEVRRFDYFQIDVDETVTLGPLDQRQHALYSLPLDPGPVEALVAALHERGLAAGHIGYDEVGMLPQNVDRLRELLPDARLTRCYKAFERVRMIKTEEEIDRLRQSARVAELSIEAALAAAREGLTEREMARVFHTTTVQNDAFPVLGCIGFGERSALINAQPSDRALRGGDVIRFDVGGRCAHYRADIARIASFGPPAPRVASYYRALEVGVLHGYDIMRPGLRVADLFDQVVAAVQREGIPHYRRSHVGHGIGIEGYDQPSLSPGSDAVLEEGMVLCIETPYYELGFAGLQVEDMVRITADGVESLMQIPTGLRVL